MNPYRTHITITGTRRQRVAYAERCILARQTDSREFDNCFEMHDGDEVVAALCRHARGNPALWQACIELEGHGEFPPSWLDAERRLANAALPLWQEVTA